MMRLLSLALPVLLAACATTPDRTVYLRSGAPAIEATQAFAACRGTSDARFPERRVVTVDPIVDIGVGINSRGRVRGGLGTTLILDRSDRNAAVRAGALEACMARAGYQAAVVPACDGPSQALTVQPFDLRGLCATEDGTLAAPL